MHCCVRQVRRLLAGAGRLVKIPAQNNQVAWIIGDADVHAFYGKLLDKYAKLLKQEDAEALAELVEKGRPEAPDNDLNF